MSTIITRAGKGSALTHNEMDTNLKKAAQTKAIAYTILESDNRDTIEYSGAGSVAFTLPDIATVVAAADTGDFEVTIKHVGTGELTIARTTGTDTIDGTAADIILSANDSVTLKSTQAGTGVNVISGKYKGQTITSPDIDKVVDSSGNEVVIFAEVASAVNELTITNAAGSNKPSMNQTGADNVGLDIEGVEIHNGISKHTQVVINGAAATDRFTYIETAGSTRWQSGGNSAAESGANAGSDFGIYRYDDAGTLIAETLHIDRASGLVTMENLSPSSLVASSTIGAVGTYAFLGETTTTTTSAGATRAGATLVYAGIRNGSTWAGLGGSILGTGVAGALAGTWLCMGDISNLSSGYGATMWLRIA